MDNKRLGIIKLSSHTIMELTNSIADVFSLLGVFPISCRDNFERLGVDYCCLSNNFDIVEEGQLIPVYDLNITEQLDLYGKPEIAKAELVNQLTGKSIIKRSVVTDIKRFLISREPDIAYGIEDFDELREAFVELIGRDPKRQ